MITLLLSFTQAFGWKSIKTHAHNLKTQVQARVGSLDQNTKEIRAEYQTLVKTTQANLKTASVAIKKTMRNRNEKQRNATLNSIKTQLDKDMQEIVEELATINRTLPQEESSPQDTRVLNGLKASLSNLQGELNRELGFVRKDEQ